MISVYDWAKRYIAIGWSVFPVNNDKTPAIKEVIPFRTRYATDEELHTWFDGGKKGIAVVTGKLSGIIVLDDDSAKKGGMPPEMIVRLRSSVVSRTGTGGSHFFLQYEEGFENRVKIEGNFVDIRTEGGFVIIPPTIRLAESDDLRKSTGLDLKLGQELKYEWLSAPTSENLKKMPALSQQKEVAGYVKRFNSTAITPQTSSFLEEGGRNDGLFKLARSLLNKNSKEWVWDYILHTNANYHPPMPESEVRTIFNQAVKYYLQQKGELAKYPKQIDEVVLTRMKERELEKKAPSTGYPRLDNLIIGFIPGNLYCVTGETNSGKTTFCCNLAVAVSKQNKKVLYIALETGNKIVEVLASIRHDKPYFKLTPDDLKDASGNIDLFVDRDIENIQDLEKTLTELDQHYDLIVIDHIGYFVSDRANYLQEQANILKRLRYITKEKNTAIIIVAHLRKRPNEASRKKDFAPTSDDIAGSASFKQDSTDVMIIIRKKDDLDSHHIKVTDNGWLYVTKTKGNGCGVVDLKFFDVDYNDKRAIITEASNVDEKWASIAAEADKRKEEKIIGYQNTRLDLA